MKAHGNRRHALAPALLLLALSCGQRASGGRVEARHLVLISIDTLRADHLGCYGHPRSLTPTIDALASTGVRFDQATSAAPTTLASHSAIMTGTPPHTHGVPRNGFVLSDANVTLAEVLAREGFLTLATVGAFPLAAPFGLNQGFSHYDDDFGDSPDTVECAKRTAERVTDAALAEVDRWVTDLDHQRVFLFVHFFDVHAPHVPPPPFDGLFRVRSDPIPRTVRDGVGRASADHYSALLSKRFEKKHGYAVVANGIPPKTFGKVTGKPRGIDRMLDRLYLGELAYVDQELGRLLSGLQERGILDGAAVILTADHGETMWEHEDFWNHGLAVYETTVHVPLIVRAPVGSPSVQPGLVVRSPVSGIDIAPTALRLLGFAIPDSMEGVDLGPALLGFGSPTRPIFTEATMPYGAEETDEPWINAAKPEAVRIGCWKYVRWNSAGHEQLFDLGSDPGERRNLLTPPVLSEHRAEAEKMSRTLDVWRASARPFPTEWRVDEDFSTQDALDALGYGGGD